MITILDNYEFNLKYITYPLLYILIGVITFLILKRLINNNLFYKKDLLKKRHYKKKVETVRMMLTNLIKYIIIIIVILAILPVYGINVKSIVAGLGITAAILGLAFQDIAKDLLAGIFIISEDQYEVGDTIQIGDFMGEVTRIGLKTTRIKDIKGRTKIIANHNITEVINYNLEDSVAIIDVSVAYEENLDKVEKILESLAEELTNSLENLKGKVEILGINELDDSAVVYRITARVSSMEQFKTERIIRKKIKDRFEKEKIKIPYPQIEVHHEK